MSCCCCCCRDRFVRLSRDSHVTLYSNFEFALLMICFSPAHLHYHQFYSFQQTARILNMIEERSDAKTFRKSLYAESHWSSPLHCIYLKTTWQRSGSNGWRWMYDQRAKNLPFVTCVPQRVINLLRQITFHVFLDFAYASARDVFAPQRLFSEQVEERRFAVSATIVTATAAM